MEDLNYDEILTRWLANELTEEELATFQQRDDYADLKAIVDGMDSLSMPELSTDELWEKLLEKRQQATPIEDTPSPTEPASEPEVEQEAPTPPPYQPENEDATIRGIGRRNWIYGMAAALALALVALFWLRDAEPNYSTMVSTQPGEQKELSLPDNSEVELNAATTLGFDADKWVLEREVYLDGEAFFRAKKGKTFTVITKQGIVKVIGTQFNVYARGTELEVKCTEGQVQVLNPEGTEKALIKRSEQVSVINGRMQKRRGLDFTPKWYKGESIFRNAPRSKVLNELRHQFGVTLVLPPTSEDASTFTVKFVNNDLNKALKMVSVPMGLEYRVSNDTVWFSPKK